jgi:hypothetical protein
VGGVKGADSVAAVGLWSVLVKYCKYCRYYPGTAPLLLTQRNDATGINATSCEQAERTGTVGSL